MAMTPLHAAIGIGIVTLIPNPFISLPLAFLSHFLVDLYPEWYNKDQKLDLKEIIMGVIEALLFFLICFVVYQKMDIFLVLGAFLANLPDVWDAIYPKFSKRKSFWFCHPEGWFPFKVQHWQEFGMRPLQTAALDSIFVVLICFLIL